MRTLKKTLSLLLAVALVLSLTVVGASAAYTGNKVDTLKDAADVGADYSEAVGVMVGLGIIEGYDDGTLRPETNYTREQAAKIIAYMQLGPEKADSLRCTTAPFTDVAADRWSAGYIAYGVEQGIIDGMGDGTFQPEAQLTGYQWAKMLLCAVGYGRNDEYVGSSWSLNTAKDALDKGIFDGDLVGADHTPLQRQQAILYAFNALTNEKASVVVYSPSLGDYIWAYGDFADRVTYEGTLGWNVYKLASNTGIIVDNEAMGNATTVLSSKYTAGTATDADAYVQCAVAANTGLDMMYHAAKIWHVNGKTAVYVMDLATAEVANCPADKKTDYSIGNHTKGADVELYEIATVDNTAIGKDYGKVTVGYTYALDKLGTRSEVKKTTVIGAEGAVANDDIKTDISKINRGDAIIYIKAESTTSDGEGFHVSPVSYTKATIKDYSKVKKTVTLDNGDVLSASKFFNGDWSDVGFGTTVTITLDTHGHFIDFDAKSAKVIGYFTGTIRNSTAHDAWYSDAAFAAQFVNITTGETEEVPVSAEWVKGHGSYLTGDNKGYYDITDTIYGSDNYAPNAVSESSNVYASGYVFDDGIRFDATTYKISGVHSNTSAFDGNVYFDNDTVTFIIANDRGSKLTIEKYTGTEEMLAAYSENYPVAAITLRNLAVTGHFDDQGTFYADVIFAFDGAESVSSGTLFYPENVTADVYPGGLYRFEGGYMNGTEFLSDSVIRNTNATITRGFYTFTVNNAGVWTLTESRDYEYTKVTVRPVSDTKMYITSNNTGVEREVLAEAKIVDLRSGAGTEVDTIKELSDLYYKNNNEYHNAKVILAYTWDASNKVNVIYVLDAGLYRSTEVKLSDELVAAGWTFADGDTSKMFYDDDCATTYYLVNENLDLTGISYQFPVTTKLNKDAAVEQNAPVEATMVGKETVSAIKVTVTPPTMATGSDYVIEIGGLTNKVAMDFDVATEKQVEYGIDFEAIAAGKYVYGTPIELDITVKFDTNGNQIDLTFSNTSIEDTFADMVIEHIKTIDNDQTAQVISLTLYPLGNGTWTLSNSAYSDTIA